MTYVRSLPDHSLLDRIIRGRAWIPLLGVLLAGIVAMQVEVLKLGASIGRSVERGTALESRNAILRADVAELSDEARIEQVAGGMGMAMPGPSEVKFAAASGGGDVQRAISNIHAPDPTAFSARLQAAALASGPTASGTTASGTTASGTTASGASVTATPATTAASASASASASGTATQSTPSTGPSVGATPPSTSATPTVASQTGTTSSQAGPSGGTATPTQG